MVTRTCLNVTLRLHCLSSLTYPQIYDTQWVLLAHADDLLCLQMPVLASEFFFRNFALSHPTQVVVININVLFHGPITIILYQLIRIFEYEFKLFKKLFRNYHHSCLTLMQTPCSLNS